MKWSLYKMTDKGWAWVGDKPSGDACKTLAKKLNRSEFQTNLGFEFLIRTPVGNNWMRSLKKGSWKMTWVYAESGD